MERRAYARHLVRIETDARVRGRSRRITVYDLSIDGCMIEATEGFADAGDMIGLTFHGGIRAFGKVIWTQDKNAGVQFENQLHPATVAHLGFIAPEWVPAQPSDRFGRPLASLRLERSQRL